MVMSGTRTWHTVQLQFKLEAALVQRQARMRVAQVLRAWFPRVGFEILTWNVCPAKTEYPKVLGSKGKLYGIFT